MNARARLARAEERADALAVASSSGPCPACGPGGFLDVSAYGAMLAAASDRRACRFCGAPYAETFNAAAALAARRAWVAAWNVEWPAAPKEWDERAERVWAMVTALDMGQAPEVAAAALGWTGGDDAAALAMFPPAELTGGGDHGGA